MKLIFEYTWSPCCLSMLEAKYYSAHPPARLSKQGSYLSGHTKQTRKRLIEFRLNDFIDSFPPHDFCLISTQRIHTHPLSDYFGAKVSYDGLTGVPNHFVLVTYIYLI